ncbi:Polysaccharide biosynthesis protein [uncultured Clostridium sp.]|uniref:lipopolysaccharide biosynthesis protein n=1 Tax=uncultured Clostridium sp. TaxID=59620 RepID=UPI000823171D|nr:oligosaccharide flippase family protein [uncultured Clostridium sp.]SCJ98236.1 Polysaccharide biosynthesis protein [uncultured Clostridium sp.]
MRIMNSIRNSSVGLIVHIAIMMLNFISRTYFVRLLGSEYLGINGLFTNIISMLNLVELGVGSAITYSLYKPLALEDKSKVSTIMRVYKKIYYKIGTVVLGIGIALIPFLNLFINGKYDKNIVIIFLLFLIDTIVSYFLGYKRTILEADQKIYILKLVNFIQQLTSNILAIVILILTKNYILYLVMRILVHILEDIFIIKIVENRYSYISYIDKDEFSLEEKNELKRNVKALFLHRIGGYFIFSTDNLIISKFISISTVGIFSNYTLIIESINGVIKQMINNISASYGNLIVKENCDKKLDIYNKIMFINFWIGGFSAIVLLCLINPFIMLWIGNGYTFDMKIVIVMVINFYILSMRMSINIPRTTAGLFFNDRYVCIIEAAINIITSIILVNNLGIIGVLLGTTITSISVQFITVPYLCYKHIFKKPLKEYYIRYFSYLMTTLVTAIITYLICSININNNIYINFLYKVMVCTIVPNLIFILRYIKLDEFQYYIQLLKAIGKKYNLISCR